MPENSKDKETVVKKPVTAHKPKVVEKVSAPEPQPVKVEEPKKELTRGERIALAFVNRSR